ncbi:MAG: M3 family metallopeptidase [Candidatus Bathyarchaeota archaeon]|nr:M3 family metallopeptidase [Candidatus Bathyarchaeota archaeon]MDH5494539.1 M3 family metallopeptidase [Candidatus Bathyarchaeota archaeon]
MYDWNKIRQDVENFSSELEKEWYLNLSGLKQEVNLSPIYNKYGHLFTKELILALKEKREHAKGEDERKLRHLQRFFASRYLVNTVKEVTEKADTMESKETVRLDGETIPFRQAFARAASEPNREKRSRLYEARNEVVERINVLSLARTEKLHETSKELGYSNYAALFETVRGIDFHQLEKLMQDFIAKTESTYVNRMENALLDKVGVGLDDAELHDMAFLLRARECDEYFPKEGAVRALSKMLARLGFCLEGQKNIMIDMEERPTKSPRAFCSAIRIPQEIKLVILPQGGQDDYASLFHEAGHAEHCACTNPELAVEYKRLGDDSVSEAFAYLLEYLLTDENWLKQNTPLRETDEYLDFFSLSKLYFLRRYGAKLSYELKLHRADTLEGMDEVYKETLEEILKFKHPKNRFLTDWDDGFYCTQYLRAWIFEEQLRATLKERFGEEWFNNKEAGAFLKNLWAYGQKYDAVELARMLGYRDLSIEQLLSSLQKRFS